VLNTRSALPLEMICNRFPYHLRSLFSFSLKHQPKEIPFTSVSLPLVYNQFNLGFRLRSMVSSSKSVTAAVNAANESLQFLVKSGGFDRVMEKVSESNYFYLCNFVLTKLKGILKVSVICSCFPGKSCLCW